MLLGRSASYERDFRVIPLLCFFIRSALEVNPFLMISALTERIVENIIASLSHDHAVRPTRTR
jgi:hypothetical protein